MLRFLMFVCCCLLVSAVQGQTKKKWYEGGTLHKKGVLEWQAAKADDKLATCADFVASLWDKKLLKPNIQRSISSVDDYKPYAQQLVAFIDAASKKDPDDASNRVLFTNQTVAEFAVIGAIQLGWVAK